MKGAVPMLSRADKAPTGLVLLAAGALGTFFLASLFLKIGELEYRAKRIRTDEPGIDAQGLWLTLEKGRSSAFAPAVLQDGSLDDRFEFSGLVNRHGHDVAVFYEWGRVPARDGALTGFDYRVRRMWWIGMGGFGNEWVCSPALGLLRVGIDGRLEGSLTDEGWKPGVRLPSSFNRMVFWYPDLDGNLPFPFEYALGNQVFLYATPDALYRADLLQRRIDRIASIDASRAICYPGPYGRVYFRTPGRILWVELKSEGASGSFEEPESFRKESNYQMAMGREGKLILRARRASAGETKLPRYHVEIVHPGNGVEREYDYAVNVEGARLPEIWRMPNDFESYWGAIIGHTVGGRLAAVVCPPIWRGSIHFAGTRFHRALERAFKAGFDLEFICGRPAWSAALSLALAGFVIWRARRHARSWVVPTIWGAFVLAFGLPAALTWTFLGGREPVRACGRCGRRHSTGLPACPGCGEAAPKPARLGIEIFTPVREA